MSAILDALKRQEEERRRSQGATESAAERLLAQQPTPHKTGLGKGLAITLGLLMIGGLSLAPFLPEEGPLPQSAPPAAAPPLDAPSAPTPSPDTDPRKALARDSRSAPGQTPEPLATVVAGWRVSAHIYGELKEDRALWINGRAYGEGDQLEGLTLEAITLEGFRVRRGQESLTRRVTQP